MLWRNTQIVKMAVKDGAKFRALFGNSYDFFEGFEEDLGQFQFETSSTVYIYSSETAKKRLKKSSLLICTFQIGHPFMHLYCQQNIERRKTWHTKSEEKTIVSSKNMYTLLLPIYFHYINLTSSI